MKFVILLITFLQFHYLKIKYFRKLFKLVIIHCEINNYYSKENVIIITNNVKQDFYNDNELYKIITKINIIRKLYDIDEINLIQNDNFLINNLHFKKRI